MAQPASPDTEPIPTDPEASSAQATPSSTPTASIPHLPIPDSLTSLSEPLDYTGPMTEDINEDEISQYMFPGPWTTIPVSKEWTIPTSGEIAFLASLPTPTVDLDGGTSAAGDPDSTSLEVGPIDKQAHLEDATAGQSGPATEADKLFVAAGRQWSTAVNETILFRRETLAIGERWGRHIRIIDVGNGKLGDASRK